MWEHTVPGLCLIDSLPTHPDSLQIELIHLLYSTCWREGLSCELLLLKKFFHVISNVESLDNQTFLSYLVDSFIKGLFNNYQEGGGGAEKIEPSSKNLNSTPLQNKKN